MRNFPALKCLVFVVLSTVSFSALALEAFFVVGNPDALSSGDAGVRDELESLGFTVELIDDNVVSTASADGRDVVIVSGTVNSGAVGNRFNGISIPVMSYEPFLFDNLGMTGAVSTQDFGLESGQTALTVVGGSPLSGGLSGTVTVGNQATTFSWGDPVAGAVIGATIVGNASRAALFGFDTGATLGNGTTAPARRVGLYLWEETAGSWNAAGRSLFGTALNWALAGDSGTGGPVNEAPVVSAGADISGVVVGSAITLTGSVNDDGVALPLTVEWLPLPGVSFGDPTDPGTTVTFSSAGQFTLELVADDTEFTVSDTVEVTVQAGPSSDGDVLLVVGNSDALSSADEAVRSELISLGLSVQIADDDEVTTDDGRNNNLTLISASVISSKIANKFNALSRPVMSYEPFLYDNLGLTGFEANQDFGVLTNQSAIEVVGNSELSAGFSGVVNTTTIPANLSWGVVGSDAIVAATVLGDSTRATIFGYEAGSELANGSTTPARRVGFYLGVNASENWTADGRVLFAAAVFWALDSTPLPVVQLLALGDSITNGISGHWSYRRDLTGLLSADSCRIDMVGSLNGPTDGNIGNGDFDRDHEGHRGFTTEQILDGLPEWLPQYEPDVALIHIGTNDILNGLSINIAVNNVIQIISNLRFSNPNMEIFLAQIIPNLPANENEVISFNNQLLTAAAAQSTPQSPITIVDQYSGYDTFLNNFDQVHPNTSGESIIANRWRSAITQSVCVF